MESKENKEIQEFLDSIKSESIYPDSNFKSELKYKFVTKAKGHGFFYSLSWSSKFLAFSFVMLFLFILSFSVVSAFLLLAEPEEAINEKEVFSNVVKANKNFVNSTTNTFTVANTIIEPITESQAPTSDNPDVINTEVPEALVASIINDSSNNFSETKIKIAPGPKSNFCGEGDPYFDLPEINFENYNYYNAKSGEIYSKYKNINPDGVVLDYNLVTPDSYIEYKGGSYAIKIEQDNTIPVNNTDTAPVSFPETDSSTSDNVIESLFGENANVEKAEMFKGRKHYVITWESVPSCPTQIAQNINIQFEEMIINRAWVDAETFTMSKQEEYFGNIADGNLIRSVETSTNLKNVNFDEVSDMFVFEYEVKVIDKDLSQNYSQNMQDALFQFVKENQILVPNLTSNRLEITSFFSAKVTAPSLFDYRKDRDFYPSTEAGEQMYQFYISSSQSDQSIYPDFAMNFKETLESKEVSVTAEPKSKSFDQIKKDFYVENSEPLERMININGVSTGVTLFEEKLPANIIMEGNTTSTWIAIAEVDGRFYVFRSFRITEIAEFLSLLHFNLLDANLDEDAKIIKGLLNKALNYAPINTTPGFESANQKISFNSFDNKYKVSFEISKNQSFQKGGSTFRYGQVKENNFTLTFYNDDSAYFQTLNIQEEISTKNLGTVSRVKVTNSESNYYVLNSLIQKGAGCRISETETLNTPCAKAFLSDQGFNLKAFCDASDQSGFNQCNEIIKSVSITRN